MAKNKKKLEHIQVKDNGIKLSNKVGDALAATKQLIEKRYFEGLLKASDETSMVRYKIAQNNAFKEFQTNTAAIVKKAKTEAKTTLQDDKTVNLNAGQVKAISAEVDKGLLYLQQDAINEYQKTLNTIIYKVHAASELKEQLAKHIESGLNIGVVYKDGKQYQFDSYFEMKARTEIQQDIGKNMVETGQASGVVFYISAFFGDCAPDHALLNGKLFCDEKWESMCPKDRLDEVREYIESNKIMTVQEAMGEPYYYTTRPNCRHYFQYISIDEVLGAKTEEQVNDLREEKALNFGGKYQPDKYKALQEQRQNERKIRAEKANIQELELKQRLEPDNKKIQIQINNSKNLIKGYQADQRLLEQKYDNIVRRYDREKLGGRVDFGFENINQNASNNVKSDEALKKMLESNRNDFEKAIRDKTIIIDKIAPAQKKHIPNTNEYKTATRNGNAKSIITIAPEKLLNNVKDAIILKKKDGQFEGFFIYDKVVGRYINKNKNVDEPTKTVMIKISNKGVHFVPINPRKDVKKWLKR